MMILMFPLGQPGDISWTLINTYDGGNVQVAMGGNNCSDQSGKTTVMGVDTPDGTFEFQIDDNYSVKIAFYKEIRPHSFNAFSSSGTLLLVWQW